MALNKPSPPPQVIDAFRDGLASFLAGPSFGPVGSLAHEVELSRPNLPTYTAVVGHQKAPEHDWQEVFSLGLDALQARRDLTAATSVAWRCFAGKIPGPVVVGYIAPRPSGWKLTGVNFGTSASNSLTDSQALDSLSQVQTGDYDLRFLRITGLNLELFWLTATPGGDDLIIPSPNGQLQLQGSLSKKRFFAALEFLSIVYALATQRLSYPATMGS